MFAFTRFSLTRQFMAISLSILLTGMLVIGVWVSRQIEQGVLNRTAAITALYVDSFISPHLQSLDENGRLPAQHLAELDRLLAHTSLNQQIVSFKVWSPAGRIIYNPDADIIGRQFAIEGHLAQALTGEVSSELSDLQRPEHEFERQNWDELIETYAPVRAEGSDEVIAVSEFYQKPDDLAAEIRAAQLRSWLVVGIATLAMYLLLTGLVGRASNTILAQQTELENQLTQVRELLAQNQQLHDKVSRAAARTTALNEQFLRRISADLHDGPGQDMALALMRLEPMRELCADCVANAPDAESQTDNIRIIHNALDSALRDLRLISTGLRLPELTHLSPQEVARRAVRDYKRKTGQKVPLDAVHLPETAPIPVKITLYRVVQEALANGYHHAQGMGQSVQIWQENERLCAEVADTGSGFHLAAATRDGRLGLVGMRERVELLGGTFTIQTAPGQGTRVRVMIPLDNPRPVTANAEGN